MKPEELKKEEEIKKIEEDAINELEKTEVSGGQEAEEADGNTQYFQCGCQNHKCGVTADDHPA